MKNAEKEICRLYGEKVVDINNEIANLDVVAEIKKDDSNNEMIIVECGDSYAHKLLEVFGNVYSDIPSASQFWVLNYADEKTKNAEYYKFFKKENYR